MVSVTFFAKNGKGDKQGKVPLYAKVYRSEKDYATIYCKVRVIPKDWDGFLVLPTEPFFRQYNAMLERMKAEILKQCVNHDKATTEDLKRFYLDTFRIKANIGDLVNSYIKHKLEDPEMTNKDTIRTYKTHCRAIMGHLKVLNLYGHDASTFAYPEGRIIYQRFLKHHSAIYSNKLMWKIKSAVEWGVGERMVEANSIQGFEQKSVPHKKITSQDYLSMDEVVRLISASAPEKYDRAKALSTLQVFSGMAFVDLASFSEDMVTEISKQKVLVGNRSKTGHEFIVPLNLVALGVIGSYQWWDCKPILKDTYNGHLKVLAAYAGIKKNVTSHMLRRTFAQMMLDGGVSAEVVAKMLGHVSTRMLKFYAIVSSTRVLEELETKQMLVEMESRVAA